MALVRLETRLDRLWREWLEACAKAQASRDINDGIAAGRAWSQWLAEFVADGPTKSAVHAGGHRQ